MFILGIETSTRAMFSVAVRDEKSLLAERSVSDREKHCEQLLPLIDILLKETGLMPSHLSAIAVAIGPGSFTGLRIGLATAKGLSAGVGIPIIPVSTLEAMAYSLAGQRHVIAPMLVAQKEALYFALFRSGENDWVQLCPDSVGSLEEMLAQMKEEPIVHFVGADTPVLQQQIQTAFSGQATFSETAQSLNGSSVAQVGLAQFTRGQIPEQDSIAPIYISPFTPKLFTPGGNVSLKTCTN